MIFNFQSAVKQHGKRPSDHPRPLLQPQQPHQQHKLRPELYLRSGQHGGHRGAPNDDGLCNKETAKTEGWVSYAGHPECTEWSCTFKRTIITSDSRQDWRRGGGEEEEEEEDEEN